MSPRAIRQAACAVAVDESFGAGPVVRETGLAEAPKYPNAGRDWGWQWLFPATRIYVDRITGRRRRHHLHESVLQRAVKDAARHAGIAKRATCLLTGSNPDITSASGVSSIITSTPVSRSMVLMFRPSFPIIFPFTSSDGKLTTVVVASAI